MVTVDGTDFRIQEPSLFSPGWYSHKFKSAGVRYEVAVSINGGDIVHVNGPFPCGHNPDIIIFRSKLINMLGPNEMVEADRGYRGEPTKVRIPVDYKTPLQEQLKNTARGRQETVNRPFKQFGILAQRFRHHVSMEDMSLHKTAFEAVAIITQMDSNMGNCLFHIDFY